MDNCVFLFKAILIVLARKLKRQRDMIELEVVVDSYIRNITKFNGYSERFKETNYIYPSERARGRFDPMLFEKLMHLDKMDVHLFCKCVLMLNFSNDSTKGFCIKFVFKGFMDICATRKTFNKARDKFVELGLFVPVDGFKDWFIVNPLYIYKGRAKNPKRDELGQLLDWNNNYDLSNDKDKERLNRK